jgi:hypothetical protein
MVRQFLKVSHRTLIAASIRSSESARTWPLANRHIRHRAAVRIERGQMAERLLSITSRTDCGISMCLSPLSRPK